ncbi:MAG: long-chain fatty acid--CoA ligase, partial [Actinomycetota bacterium]|nr:long-chain fatty acid--CoA ligase [Actinomycetota bacterium]
AILSAGGVTVPVYETSSAQECAWILSNSGATLALAGTADHEKILRQAQDEAPDLDEVFVIADGGLDALSERGGEDDRAEVGERSASLSMDDLATIVYTSGTTGKPKGCMLTHGNILWTARQTESALGQIFGPEETTLLFLPLAHMFTRIIQFGCLDQDMQLGYARSMDLLAEDLESFQPTFLLAVPRVFEKVFESARREAQGPKRKIFDVAVQTAQDWSRADDPGLLTDLKRAVADKLVYAKLRAAVGDRVRYCLSGGAPLSPHLAHFFHAAEITILQGYGLTETSAPATVDTPDGVRFGTVGRPLPGVEVAIAEDGEILIKGANVFQGYYGNDEATKETFTEDGWLRSGDIGELDDEGYLTVTGRKKDLIVTAGGKNVVPSVLEERMKRHRLVSQAIVVGDDRPFVAALVTLDAEGLEAFADERGLSGSTAELAKQEAVREEVQEAVDHANEAVSRAESVREFVILERDFTQDRDELTPTMKPRRSVIAEHFAEDIDRIYEQ